VLKVHRVLQREGVTMEDVACRHAPARGRTIEPTQGYGLVFVRRGCFVRRSAGSESLLDSTVAYCTRPGEEQSFDHPQTGGDDCTIICLDPTLTASVWGGDETLPSDALPTSPRIDLQHRLLLAAGRRGATPDELVERAISVVAQALEEADPRRVAAGRPATERARRALADGAREALAADPDRSLLQLARMLAVSPHHLSRVFRSVTGRTISRQRMRLRARAALERLAGGEHDLARLAADVGCADQSHLCRVIRVETGRVPSALRHAMV
jgi:AraC-like DNA-binding protein